MKTLLLMRHGDAPSAAIDKDRMLSDLGKQQCESMAKVLKTLHANGLTLRQILTSDYQRAIDSANLMTSAYIESLAEKNSHKVLFSNKSTFNKPLFNTSVALQPLSDPKQAFHKIMQALDTLTDKQVLLVVCHMPIISALAALAVDGNMQYQKSFSCAGIMHLQSELSGLACFDFVSYSCPKQ